MKELIETLLVLLSCLCIRAALRRQDARLRVERSAYDMEVTRG